METKKSDKANLEKKKIIFFQLGLLLILSASFVIFEWKIQKKDPTTSNLIAGIDIEYEMLPVKRIEKPKPKPQKNNHKPISEIEIITNNKETNNISEKCRLENADNIKIEYPEINKIEVSDPKITYNRVEKMPEFEGGIKELQKFIVKNIRYPQKALENDVQGRVYVKFLVTRTGKIDCVKVVKKVHKLLDKEAVRLVKTMPDWKPGTKFNQPVNVWQIIPVVFVIR